MVICGQSPQPAVMVFCFNFILSFVVVAASHNPQHTASAPRVTNNKMKTTTVSAVGKAHNLWVFNPRR
jgi:hypothetical protein